MFFWLNYRDLLRGSLGLVRTPTLLRIRIVKILRYTTLSLISLALWSSTLHSAQAFDCAAMLGGDFIETSSGVWVKVDGRMIFLADGGGNSISPMSSASHAAILRKQLGSAVFDQIMASPHSDKRLAEAVGQIVAGRENPAEVLDAETVKERVQQVGSTSPLPSEVERDVFRVLDSMERNASDLTQWLKPKFTDARIRQLNSNLFDWPEITRFISETTIVYKAVLVEVKLNDAHALILSGGRSGIPDLTHQETLSALELMVPRERVLAWRPGYVLVRGNDTSMVKGSIEFRLKGSSEALRSEFYDFTGLAVNRNP